MGKNNRVKNQWTEKQKLFLAEYLIDYNATRAAAAAGYKSPHIVGSQLIAKPHIAKAIREQGEAKVKELELTREEILLQLYYLATRKASDFVNEDGEVKNVHDMSERAQAAIDGIEQEVFYNAETGDKKVHTKLKLSPKATAIDLAMKHKGLFAPDRQDVKMVRVDLTQLYDPSEEPDEIENKIKAVEALPPPKTKPKG